MHPIYKKLQKIVREAEADKLDNLTTKILLKEYLQTHILSAIYNSPHGQHLIFYGGTALRKAYGLDRMSEDLDFTSSKKINLSKLADTISDYFKKLKFKSVDYKIQSGKLINRITFKFNILFKLGLSPMVSEKLHLKVEISHPSSSRSLDTQISMLQENQISTVIKHYSLPVLMAGKIIACLERVFKKGDTDILIKGRDFYDLIWYMRKEILPDKKRLKQSNYTTLNIWPKLDKKVASITPKDLIADLRPFFTSISYTETWCQNFHSLYSRYREFYN